MEKKKIHYSVNPAKRIINIISDIKNDYKMSHIKIGKLIGGLKGA